MHFTLGRYEATIVSAGTFALDGGAMFGIIPKPLWEKKIPADDKNRIPMGTNCLLLRDGKRTVLVDCGMGDKWADKQKDQFKVDTTLATTLPAAGCSFADVTDVVLTHLHFDHAGGLTRLDGQGALSIAFPNARVHVGRRNWEWAQRPNDRDRGSYRDDSWRPLLSAERDRLVLVDDDNRAAHLFDDVDAIFCEGHTTGQMLPLVGRGDRRALYGADMVPTRAHVRMPWIMGYDLRPIELLDEKRRLLGLCADEGVALVYEHDVGEPATGVARDGDDFLPAALPTGFVQAMAVTTTTGGAA
jgi:glyoxylase-like metal-dependent hydrolase (beta-lactamase superfamily II)